MRKSNLKNARDHLKTLIDEVSEGQEIVLTRRGEPVARLMPLASDPPPLPSLAAHRDTIRVRGRALSDDVIAARDDERY